MGDAAAACTPAICGDEFILARNPSRLQIDALKTQQALDAGRSVVRTAGPGEVTQRMPERRELPVEHGDDARLSRMEDDILDTIIAVRDRRLIRRRNVAPEPFDEAVHLGDLVYLRRFVLF